MELGSVVKLQAHTWGNHFTADVRGSDDERVGYITAYVGDFHSLMRFFTPSGQLVASAHKPTFTWGVDRTTIEDCHGNEILKMEQLQVTK